MFFQKTVKIIPRDKLIIRRSFAMFFGGGEVWCEDLDALSVHTDIVKHKFLQDMKSVRRPSTPSVVAMNLNETLITPDLAVIFARTLQEAGYAVTRVVYTGLDSKGKKLIKMAMAIYPPQYRCAFISDFEKAKLWLVQ